MEILADKIKHKRRKQKQYKNGIIQQFKRRKSTEIKKPLNDMCGEKTQGGGNRNKNGIHKCFKK